MKKLFIKFSMMLFVLGMSTNTVWADDQSSIYLASLKAQTDPASTGSGQVKLTWLDITGKPMWVNLAKQMNYMAFGDKTFLVKDYVYDGFGETAQLEGGTLIAIEGTEAAVEIGGTNSQIYMTSVVYFHAEAEPANGSYLADWTFTDPKITRMTSSMTISDPMGDGSEERPYRTPCFKVLPKLTNSTLYPPTDGGAALAALCASVAAEPNNLYALFSRYLLSNPVATNAVLEATPNAEANLTVTVEINGDAASLDAADFATFTFANNGSGEWEYDLDAALAAKEVISDQKTRITIPVTYTYKNTGFGLKNTTMTISMAGENPSTLNVNMSVNALDPDRAEAFWFDGETEKTSGDLADMLDVNISGYSKPILKLNKPVATDLTFSDKDFTLDLNGNTTQAITVSSGNVTIAYSQYVGSATSLTVNGGKAILNGGTFASLTIGASGTVEQNGATITGAATNNGSLTTTEGTINGGLTSSKTLVINGGTFKGATAVTVSGGTAAINRGTIEGTTCGLKVTGGQTTVKKLAAIKGETYSAQQTGGTLTVESGKFDGPLNGTIDFTAGFFKTNTYGISTEGKKEMNVSAGVEYNEGYRYFLGTTESAQTNGVGVCRIGAISYSKLEDAIAYANNNPSVENIVIFMTNDYTLPAGYYTLPANATIVVPMSDSQEKEINMTAPRIIFNDVNNTTPYVSVQPTEFRRLTFASGVNMDMFGDIELTCSQYASNEAYTAQPCGAYGRMVLEEGSHITLQNGSEFRAWGFVTGKGEMDARRGAKVREMFQLGDWKGAMTSVQIVGLVKKSENPTLYGVVGGDHSDKKIFPVTQYFIQNIESPVKYHPGAVLSTSAAVSEGLMGMSVSMAATDIAIVGVSGQHQAIFLMDQMADADNTWVRKWYDVENDIQVYDINSAAHIGSMVLDMGDINLLQFGTVPIRLNSAKFDLPLTCNFKIHLLSGTMDFLQNTCLLPGAEVEVDKESTVTVAKDKNDVEHTGALYVYDAEEWSRYAFKNEYGEEYNEENPQATFTKTVRYSPSWNGRPTKRAENTCPPDATINVHGTFMTATGFVYCSEHGANIFSNNEDAGTFVFNESAAEAGTRDVYQVMVEGTNSLGKNTKFEYRTFYPAKLKNGVADPAFANTADAEAGDAYCYQNDEWSTMIVDPDDPCFMVEQNVETGDKYYIKPADYVQVIVSGTDDYGYTGNADHTFSDADGAGRLFILMFDACQWWEVEKKDNLYHCIHPQNDTYYYWDDSDENPVNHKWKEKTYTITWKNWDGTIIQTADADGVPQNSYEVTYGTMAEFLGTNPTREKTIDYTYDFTGWTPALGPVTSDVTYTATFTQKPRMYTIIFQNEGGVEIERQFLTHNEVPVCENVPTKVGHTLVWTPAIAAVTADATYTATWLENPPTEYEVTFFDYDGTTPLQQGNVAVGAMPEYTGSTPTGKATWAEEQDNKEFTYVFDHWSPALEEVSATSIKSYTAIYREVPVLYTVVFLKEGKNPLNYEEEDVIESHQYQYGETPICSNPPAHPEDADLAQYTYMFKWNPQIQAVMEDIVYVADFDRTINRYAVTLKCNPSGAATLSGAGMYDYDASENAVTLNVTSKADGYTFLGWSNLDANDPNAIISTSESLEMPIVGDVNFVANFECNTCNNVTIYWKNYNDALLKEVSQAIGTATTYTGAIPTRDADDYFTYAFDGWSTIQGGDLVYKNGMTPKAAEGGATYYAHFAQTPIPDLVVPGNGAPVVLTETATYSDLVISSDGLQSSQLINADAFLDLKGDAFFDLTLNATPQKWYAVAVPWQVVAGDIEADGNPLSWGSGNYLAYYDGSVRAAQGKVDACWKYLSNNDVLVPGRLYMAYLEGNAAKLRFPKKEGADILNTSTDVYEYSSGTAADANWNGIANPAIFYAYLNNTGASVGQVFNAAAQSYEPVALSNKLIVAKPIFVQAANNGTASAVTTPPAPAPVRRNVVDETLKAEFQVEIASYGRMQDRLFIRTNDNKEADTYTLGQDVLKFGISNSVAQMWVNRYDAKLCMNTVVPFNNVAEFPLSIFAPRAGEYTISKVKSKMSKECDLYLTHNGEAIWNLSESNYVMTLEQGTTDDYGLRVSAKAPQVATGMDEAVVDAQGETKKVLIDNKVFIIRGNKVYSIDGRLAK